MKTWSQPFRHVPLLAAACVLPLFLSQTAAGQLTPPTVAAVFEIQAVNFKDNLPVEARRACETAVAGKLAEACAEAFSYLRWQGVTVEGAPAWENYLKLDLVSTDRGFGYEVALVFTGRRGPAQVRFPQIPPMILYAATNPDQPTQDEERLQSDLIQRLTEEFRNEDLRNRLQKQFLSTIPIAREMFANEPMRRFIVPIPWEQLQAGNGSVLTAQFRALPPQSAAPFLVTIRLEPDAPVLDARWPGQVGCLVLEFRHPVRNFFEKGQWDDLMPVSLQQRVTNTLDVLMEKYEKDFRAGTAGGLSLDPR